VVFAGVLAYYAMLEADKRTLAREAEAAERRR